MATQPSPGAALDAALAPRLAARQQADSYRLRRAAQGPAGAEIRVDGARCVNFSGNDYLGLAAHPAVVRALQQGADRYGVGAGAAHLVTGHTAAHHALEEALAAFTNRPRALLFSTGYMANLGVLAALAGRGDRIFQDRLNHASLLDGARLAGARLVRYRHADADALAEQLSSAPPGRRLVVTDGVFSMDGDEAPLDALAAAATAHGAWLVVDDAHGLGVTGASGRGSLERFGLDHHQAPVLVGTLGKAFGTFGAFVAGSETLIESLIQFARPYIYTTALPPAVAVATRVSLRLAEEEAWRREHLQDLIARFRRGAAERDLPLMRSGTPIQPLTVGEAGRAVALARSLERRGYRVAAIRPPTVPEGTSRLRITLSAAHSEAQVDGLLEALVASLREVG